MPHLKSAYFSLLSEEGFRLMVFLFGVRLNVVLESGSNIVQQAKLKCLTNNILTFGLGLTYQLLFNSSSFSALTASRFLCSL